MGNVLAATAPIYLILAAGFLAVRTGWMAQADLRVLGRFAGQVCLPVLVFNAVVRAGPGGILHADYLWVYGLGAFSSFAIVMTVVWKVRGKSLPFAAIAGLGVANSNSAFVGYPIVAQVLGPVAGAALALNMLIENLLIIPLAMAIADIAAHQRQSGEILRTTLKSLLRNQVLVAVVAGLAFSATGWQLPAFVDKALGMVAVAASPTSLFFIGGSLVGLQIGGMRGDIGLIAAAKLILHPALVALFALLIGISQPELRWAAILYAAMPMLSIYPVLAMRHGHERFCAAALLVTTAVSFLTISALIALMGVRVNTFW